MKAWWVLCLMLLLGGPARAQEPLPAAAGEDIPLTRHAAPGRTLILWLPSEHGVMPQEQAAARRLAARGYETWVADLYGARFLPAVPSSMDTLPAEDVYTLLAAAFRHKPRVWLLTAGRGARLALEGARLWSERHGRQRPIAGAILLYPNLYAAQPEPGQDPVYLPITRHTRLRIHILQGDRSPWYWTLDSLRGELAQGGSRVSVQVLPGIRDRFHFREDATPAERALGERLPALIIQALHTTS